MGVDDRDYMRVPFSEIEDDGIVAATRAEAEKVLRFASPTQASNGRWYRTTIAVTNVPVSELYNILSNAAFITARLREIARLRLAGEDRLLIEFEADRIEQLRQLLKQGEGGGVSPFPVDPEMFKTEALHVHLPRRAQVVGFDPVAMGC